MKQNKKDLPNQNRCRILVEVEELGLASENQLTYEARKALIRKCSPDDPSNCDCAYLAKNGGIGAT